MNTFKVGEIAVLIEAVGSWTRRLVGEDVTIVEIGCGDPECEGEYGIAVGDDRIACVCSHHLRKKRPPEETTTWDRCVWKPAGVEV